MAVVVLGLVGVACGDDGGDDGAASDGAVGTRSVETDLGVVEVPVAPERIVALDEYAGMDLLAVGVVPEIVLGTYQSEVGAQILAEAGAEVVPSEFTTTFNVEQVAGLDPDLIVFTSEANDEANTRALGEVAPTVVVPYEVPWRDIVERTAEIVGRDEEAAAVIAATERRIAEVGDAVGEARTLAVLGNTPGFGVFSPSQSAPLSQLIDEVGLARPTVEQGPGDQGSAIMTSEERLGDHDADLVVVLEGSYYDAASVESVPTFRAMPAVRDGRSFVVDGDMWLGPFPFAVHRVLDDLEVLLGGGGGDGIGTLDDVADRWAAFEATL
jgi:iron complex transport system substrate-binding protein